MNFSSQLTFPNGDKVKNQAMTSYTGLKELADE
jgi:hypothetical protein